MDDEPILYWECMLSLHDYVFIYCFAYLFGFCILQIIIGLHPKFGLEFLLLSKKVIKQNLMWLQRLATGALAVPLAVVRQEFHSASALHKQPLLQLSPPAYLLPSLLFWSTCTLPFTAAILPLTDLCHLLPPAGQDPITGWGLEYVQSAWQSGGAHLPKEVSET